MPEEEIPSHLLRSTDSTTSRDDRERSWSDPSELAVRYMLSQDGITRVLTGVETIEQVKENLAIFSSEGALTDDKSAAIDARGVHLPREGYFAILVVTVRINLRTWSPIWIGQYSSRTSMRMDS